MHHKGPPGFAWCNPKQYRYLTLNFLFVVFLFSEQTVTGAPRCSRRFTSRPSCVCIRCMAAFRLPRRFSRRCVSCLDSRLHTLTVDLSCESRIGVQPFLCWACALVRVQGGILDLLWMLLGVARSVQPAVRGAFFAGSRSRGVTVRLSWRTCGNAGMDLLIGIGFLGNDSRTPRRTLPFS